MMFPVTGWAVRVPISSEGNNGSTGELSPPFAVMGLYIKAPKAQKGELQSALVTAVLVVDQESHMQLLGYDNRMEFSQLAQPVVAVQQGAPAPAKPPLVVVGKLPDGM